MLWGADFAGAIVGRARWPHKIIRGAAVLQAVLHAVVCVRESRLTCREGPSGPAAKASDPTSLQGAAAGWPLRVIARAFQST